MTTRRSDGERTKQAILDAATHVFADNGFHDARVVDICKRAGVNPASVNYYFGSKTELYKEAWRHAFQLSIKTHPPDGGVPASAPAEERLRGNIRAIVHRIMDPASLDFDIGRQEMSSPTGLLSEIMHRSIEPLHDDLLRIVRELIYSEASDDEARLCAMSVQGQCFGLLMPIRSRRCNNKQTRRSGGPHIPYEADTIAEHIFQFSLAGIHAVRNRSRTVNEPANAGKRGS